MAHVPQIHTLEESSMYFPLRYSKHFTKWFMIISSEALLAPKNYGKAKLY